MVALPGPECRTFLSLDSEITTVFIRSFSNYARSVRDVHKSIAKLSIIPYPSMTTCFTNSHLLACSRWDSGLLVDARGIHRNCRYIDNGIEASYESTGPPMMQSLWISERIVRAPNWTQVCLFRVFSLIMVVVVQGTVDLSWICNIKIGYYKALLMWVNVADTVWKKNLGSTILEIEGRIDHSVLGWASEWLVKSSQLISFVFSIYSMKIERSLSSSPWIRQKYRDVVESSNKKRPDSSYN